jgi:hypothetical protein
MNEHIGRHVKCFLRNSTVVEGIMEGCATTIQLRSLDGKSILIIHNPEQDIVLTKVLLPQEIVEEEQPEAAPVNGLPLRGTLEPTADEEPLDPMTLKAKTIAELRIELAKQERKIVAHKLKDHRPDASQAPRKVTYGQPGFLKKPSAE